MILEVLKLAQKSNLLMPKMLNQRQSVPKYHAAFLCNFIFSEFVLHALLLCDEYKGCVSKQISIIKSNHV